MRLEPTPYYQHQPVTAPADVAPERTTAGAGAFVKAIPVAISTAATALGYVWHYDYGAAHSIGDAAVTGLFAIASMWAGYRLSGTAAKYIPSVTAAAYGLGAGLGGIAVIAYANAPVAGLVAWLVGTVVAYALASTGWTRRAEKREQRRHERDMALIHEQGKTQRTQIKADAQVQVAKELSGAWAAEQAASAAERMRMADFNDRYPSSVPMFGAAGNVVPLVTTTAPLALDVDTQLEKLTGSEFYDQAADGFELPEWLTNPDSNQ